MRRSNSGLSSAIGCKWTEIIGIRLESAALELITGIYSSSGLQKDRKNVSCVPTILTRYTGEHPWRRKARIYSEGYPLFPKPNRMRFTSMR